MPIPFTMATFFCLVSDLASGFASAVFFGLPSGLFSAAYPAAAAAQQAASSASRKRCLTNCIAVPLVTGVELWAGCLCLLSASAFNPWLKFPFLLRAHRREWPAHEFVSASGRTMPRIPAGAVQRRFCRRTSAIRSQADNAPRLLSPLHGRRVRGCRRTLPARQGPGGPTSSGSSLPCSLFRKDLAKGLHDDFREHAFDDGGIGVDPRLGLFQRIEFGDEQAAGHARRAGIDAVYGRECAAEDELAGGDQFVHTFEMRRPCRRALRLAVRNILADDCIQHYFFSSCSM